MTESDTELLSKIKQAMLLRQKAYEANRQFAKAHAIKLMLHDISERFECSWMCGYG
jgi:hypothetical protein